MLVAALSSGAHTFLLPSPTASQLVMAAQGLVAVSLGFAMPSFSVERASFLHGLPECRGWFCQKEVIIIMLIASSEICFDPFASISSTSVSSSSDFRVDHAAFFPCPAKLDTVPGPVRAWNIGRAHDTSSPRHASIWWATR